MSVGVGQIIRNRVMAKHYWAGLIFRRSSFLLVTNASEPGASWKGARRVPIEPQTVDAPLTGSAIFLVVEVRDERLDDVREVLGGIDDLVKTVGFRDLTAQLSCVVGVGSRVWNGVMGTDAPSE